MEVGESPALEASSQPQIYEATLGARGAVVKGKLITQMEAEASRRAGRDIVICGLEIGANRRLAGLIERNAIGPSVVLHGPHLKSGPLALPHWQPEPKPPHGHSFYETPNRKAS